MIVRRSLLGENYAPDTPGDRQEIDFRYLAPEPEPPHQHAPDQAKWQTIRYAIDGWGRTFRLCLIIITAIGSGSHVAGGIEHAVMAMIR